MKDFFSKVAFGVVALIVVIFLFIIIYKTLSTGDIIEKSKYEDEVTQIVNEKIDEVKNETENTINKLTNNTFNLDESAATSVKVLAEKSYSSINSEYEKFSSYCGYYIGTDGNIYMFYISENNNYGTLSLEDRNQLMILHSKRVGSVTSDDLMEIKRLVKKLKIEYDEKENEIEESTYSNTKMLAVYDYSRNQRISLLEEGKYSVINSSPQTESLQYLIGKYIKYYIVGYDEFKNY